MRHATALLALFSICLTGTVLAESKFTVLVEDKPVPEEIDPEVSEQLAPKAYVLDDGEGVIFEFWFVKELVLPKTPSSHEDALSAIEPVALLGAAVVHKENHEDFREDPIDPGAYVVRLSMQPQDGNHMGTAPYDSFAILVPADLDADVREYPDHEEMVDIALEPTATGHPPILSLQPYEGEETDFPHLSVGGDDWEMLCFTIPAKVGDETVDVALQMVIEGIGYL